MESRTDVLEQTLEDRIKAAREANTVLIDEFELDGISYCFKGWPQVDRDGSYSVLWVRFAEVVKSHGGQQGVYGYHDDTDFEDHDRCTICNPKDEQHYWNRVEKHRKNEMFKYSVTDWTPEDTDWC